VSSLVEVHRRLRGTFCFHFQGSLIYLTMKAAGTSESPVQFYQTTRRSVTEDNNRHSPCSSVAHPVTAFTWNVEVVKLFFDFWRLVATLCVRVCFGSLKRASVLTTKRFLKSPEHPLVARTAYNRSACQTCSLMKTYWKWIDNACAFGQT
jgi:hypothetical protein